MLIEKRRLENGQFCPLKETISLDREASRGVVFSCAEGNSNLVAVVQKLPALTSLPAPTQPKAIRRLPVVRSSARRTESLVAGAAYLTIEANGRPANQD